MCVVPFVIFVYLQTGRLERTVCLHLILLKLVTDAAETFEVLKVPVGILTTERTQVFEWFSKFKRGLIPVEDGEWLVCQPTSKTDEMWIE
jgi:hypothetical protein